MSKSKPPWWRAFDKVERTIGKPLEEVVASRRYVDVMLTGQKVRRAVTGKVGRVAGGAVGKVLHVVQIPTRSDVRNLNRQITELASQVRALSAEQQRPARTPPSRPAKPRPPSGEGDVDGA
jgi:hypothetical protein